MAALGPAIFTRGFRFNPSPLEVATYYLPRLVAGAPLHEAVRPVVHHADVYACEPGDLARQFCPLPRTGHRFFFTHCKLQQPRRAGKASSRATCAFGSGSWHSQGVTDVVDHAGVKVGEIRKLKYKKGGELTDWLMDEYSCCLEDTVAGDRQYVLCNMYVSPRADQYSAARQESAAFFTQAAPVVIAPAAVPKRPAPQSAEPPCPKRMRGAVAPTPPVVQPAGYCMASLAPPPPYAPHIAASAQPPPPPVPIRLAAPAPTPLHPRSLPKQQAPPPTLPVVRACHMPVQAPARHCQPPQPSVQRKQGMRDPFEVAELGDEAEEERVAAPDPKESSAALVDPGDVWAELEECVDDAVPTAEGETMTEDEMDQTKQSTRDPYPFEAAELRDEAEEESVAAPGPAQDFDIDELCTSLEEDDELVMLFEDEDNVPTAEAEQAAANSEGSTMADGAPDPASKEESPAAAAHDFDIDEFCKSMEDDMRACELDQVACSFENEIFLMPTEEIQVAGTW